VRFDPLASSDPLKHGVLFCSDDGRVGGLAFPPQPTSSGSGHPWSSTKALAYEGALQNAATTYYQGRYAVTSFDMERSWGGGGAADVVAVTEGQELVYVRRR
jgi:hypothetical protein